mmetsp:Transcript_52910/g.133070  ORF Transcript_52910/g.133070 Transcript_52910/m.133070 type:complete len:572 (+) Transcript_52910:17-1732(+)
MSRTLALSTALLLLSAHLILCAEALRVPIVTDQQRAVPPTKPSSQRGTTHGNAPPLGDPSYCTFPTPTYSLQLPNPLPVALQEALQRADQRAAALFAQNGTAGMHVSVVYNQQVLFSRGYGQVHMDSSSAASSVAPPSPPPDADTIFRVGSLTKLFTVLMLLHLRDHHRVSLETELKSLLPNYHTPNPWQTDRGITLRMLASHTSGMTRMIQCDSPCNYTDSQMLEYIATFPLLFPPDTYAHYSDAAFALLARALQSVTPLSMEDYIRENILTPLGMNSTGFDFTEAVKARMATGYNVEDPNNPIPVVKGEPNLGWMSGSAQMYSSPADLQKLVSFFCRYDRAAGYGQPLDGVTLREFFSPQFVNTDASNFDGYGLAWEFLTGVPGLGSLPFLSKNGGDGAEFGFDAQLQWAVRQKLGVIVLLSEAPSTLELDVTNAVLSEVFPVIDDLYFAHALQNSLPDQYTNLLGTFQGADITVDVTVEVMPYYNNTEQLKISYNHGEVEYALLTSAINGDTFRFCRLAPLGPISCERMEGGVGSDVNEYVRFTLDDNELAVSLRLPNSNLIYNRVKQ